MVKRAEDILQEAVVYFARLHKLPMFHPVNEGKRSLATGARLKRMGMMSGVSDEYVAFDAQHYEEVKMKVHVSSWQQSILRSLPRA